MELKRLITYGNGYPLAILSVALLAVALLPLRGTVTTAVVMLCFVPVIVLVARFAGTRASSAAAALAFLVIDLLYIPPYYHLTIAYPAEWVGLVVFLIVALVSGQQTGLLREREQAALRRQEELELLNRLSFRMASEYSLITTAEYIAEQLADVIGARRVVLYRREDDAPPTCVAAAGDAAAAVREREFVEWVLGAGKAVGFPADHQSFGADHVVSVAPAAAVPDGATDIVVMPLQTADSLEGVLMALGSESLGADEARLVVSVANLAAAAFERERLTHAAARERALRETDRMRSTFVSSVSHELKTPLAAATARVTGLVDEGASCDSDRVREELVAVAEDLDRLDSSIGDLLDLSRLEADAWRPHLGLEDLSDVLGTALSRIPRSLGSRVRFDLEQDLPQVNVDFAQLVRAAVNLIENALAYSPADSPVDVSARAGEGTVVVWVEDRGPGISDSEKVHVFEKFYRGTAASAVPAGTGLGLAIAAEVVRSHGGTLSVEDAVPQGARFVMTLPTRREGE